MLRHQVFKLFKIKVLPFSLLLLIGALLYSMAVYGEFGHDISRWLTIYSYKGLITYSEENGELISGQKGYEKNKEVANQYAGKVDDLFLAQLHSDFTASSYVGFENGKRFYNATYSFFRDIFNIGSENYAHRDDVWGNVEGTVKYGFSGDWDAYGNILNDFFFFFSFFIIIFTTPVFTYDRECNMSELLGTVEKGGRDLFKFKAKICFFTINFLMFLMIMIISTIHFLQYGFANADVNIQCSFEQKFINSSLNCTMGQLALWRLLFGIIGCNTILLSTMLISMLCRTSLSAFAISLAATWLLGYPVLQMMGNTNITNIFFVVMPVNSLYINALIKEASTWYVLWGIFIIRSVLFLILSITAVVIWRKNFLILNRLGD